MPQPSDQSLSIWQEVPPPQFSPLLSDMSCDVCIIGGGIAGLSVAYHLQLEGYDVIVIDRDQLGLHETGHSTAHLSNALDDGFQHLNRMFGIEGLKLAYESHSRAIDQIEDIVGENGIDCDFTRLDGYLFLAPETPPEFLTMELNCIKNAGGTNVEWLDRYPSDILDLGACLMFPRQAQFHPLKYLYGLAQAIERKGGRIFTQTAAFKIKGGANAHVVTARGQTIACKNIVVATNVPVNDVITVHTKLAAYRSYVIAVKVPAGQYLPRLLWDTAKPYHYVRTVKGVGADEDLLLIGGGDHRTGQFRHPEECFERLVNWTRNRLGIEPTVVAKWSGQIIEPVDSLPYIGRNPGDAANVFIVTGDSGHGITSGTMAGMILRELIAGRAHPWAQLYDPARLKFFGLETFAEENANTAAQYADWLSPGEVQATEDVRIGQGAILRQGIGKLAIYRDEHGHLHSFSATCPHLKGIVHWNDAEKTWDCPCHGSRFSRTGEVLNGPATSALTEVKLDKPEFPYYAQADADVIKEFSIVPEWPPGI